MDAPADNAPPTAISIVIATYDRPDALVRCLHALALQQTQRAVEIIVVDNHAASGLTAPLIPQFPAVRWLAEPKQGLSAARNTGIRAATGHVLVTTDDDVIPPPNWLETLTAPLFEPNGPAATTGNCLPLKVETEAERLFELYGGLGHGPTPACFDAAWMAQWRVGFPHLWRIGTTANAAFLSSVFKNPQVGLYEETLGAGTPAGAWEDLYAYYLMLRAGYRICYIPKAELTHAHRERMDQLKRQLLAYRRGETAFLTLVWQRHRDRRAWGQMLLWIPQWRARVLAKELALRLRGKRQFPLRLLWQETLAYLQGPSTLPKTPTEPGTPTA